MTEGLPIAPALLGFATGLRSSLGVNALAQTGRSRRRSLLAAASFLGEFVADKSARTPSRLIPASLAVRVLTGATVAVLAGRRSGIRPAVLPIWAALGAAGAAAGSFGGAKWRAVAAARFSSDLPGALVEDAVGFALAGSVAASSLLPSAPSSAAKSWLARRR